ncbi:MAG TPA: NADH-quinone oxidoreductase subunit J [Methylophaga sp.]|nr:MAG: NADH-quinone oxidoreductase subunit J [Gammaproteobacteria bacterium]RLA02282.1 MAG: NADH-quinone oxidoreductase subunit J [Gammaproteobacteria bacterium]HHA18919.1 NADH-quinone oxidoreductase subunit J [Methylophaga sp.]
MEQIIFYCFAATLLFASTMVITVRNPVRAALFLILAFFTSAGIWLLLEAEFLALTLVLVYVGAVMVLFLFVVMMLDIDLAPLQEGFTKYLPLGILVAALITIEMIAVLGASHFGLDIVSSPVPHPEGYSNTKEIGLLLYTVYVYPFEIASVILTVAIVAAITLTLRKKTSKTQDISQQIKVRREDRVRLVKMDAVKKQDSDQESQS